MLIGYARVSTQDQDTQAQLAALQAAGCERIFEEKASGGRWERPELHRLLGQLDEGDLVVVWKLDRLSRSLKDVLVLMEQIAKAGAGFRDLLHQHQDVFKGAGQAVELPDHDQVALVQLAQQAVELGTLPAASRGFLFEDALAAGGLEGCELGLGVLVLGGDARVAYEHGNDLPSGLDFAIPLCNARALCWRSARSCCANLRLCNDGVRERHENPCHAGSLNCHFCSNDTQTPSWRR